MNDKQRKQARKAIKSHYRLNRQPTDTEIDAEVKNIQRKKDADTLCDIAISLYAELSIGQHPIIFT